MNISPPGSEKKARIYYFDTLRAFLILLVLIIHSANMLVPSYNMGVGGNSPYLQYCIDFLPQWIIALFFLFAGAGTRFALRRRTAGQFIGERCRRLLIPLIGGFLLIAPLQAYFEALGQPGQPTNFLAFSASFLTHIPFSWNPQWMGAYLHHLWFLADLFLISLLLLPLCRFFQSDSGSKLLDKLTSFCEGHKGLAAFWLFLVPLALVQLGLRPAFPGYQNWADVFTWLLCYIYGYVLFATPRFAPLIAGAGKGALILGSSCFLLIVALWLSGTQGLWTSASDYAPGNLLFLLLHSLNLGSWLLVALAAGNRYLNFSNKALQYGSSISFSFYWLHYPLIVLAAWLIVPLQIGSVGKFLLIGLSSLLVTLILTDLFFKRLEGLRGIWGLAEGKLRARLARGYAENIRAGYGPEVEAMQPTLARGTRNLTGSLAALSFSTAPVTGALID